MRNSKTNYQPITTKRTISKPPPMILNQLNDLFSPEGVIVPVSYKEVVKFAPNALAWFCAKNAIYGIITTELIDYIKPLIEGRVAIEIGSGAGTFGRALGIPVTDSFQQMDHEEAKAFIRSYGGALIKYGEDVEKFDAVEAVKYYKPEVVIASWVTHKYYPYAHKLGGNEHGVAFDQLFRYGAKKIILLGNEATHRNNPIMKDKKYRVVAKQEPFFLSRSTKRKKNRLYIIKRKKTTLRWMKYT